MRKQFDTKEHHISPNLADSTSLSLVDIFFLLEKKSLVKRHGNREEFYKDEFRATDDEKQKLLLFKVHFWWRQLFSVGHIYHVMPCQIDLHLWKLLLSGSVPPLASGEIQSNHP